MTAVEQAKIFCRMSFVAPSKFPCVETHSAAKIFNFLAFRTFTPEDFNVFLAEIFGSAVPIFTKISVKPLNSKTRKFSTKVLNNSRTPSKEV